MSILGIRFRALSNRLKISEHNHPDLAIENIYPVIETNFPKGIKDIIRKGEDINDPATFWELLNLDAVIRLENMQGKLIRVGVTCRDKESKAYQVFSDGQKPHLNAIRKALKISRYWVFVMNLKSFPSDEEWIDMLYELIDQPTNSVGCKLINF